MPEYKKMKAAELAELLSRRGLEPGGTKTQLMSRLVMQDAEDAAAEKANAAAIRAASAGTSSQAAEGQGGWSQTRGARNGAGRKSEAMRREKGKDKGRTKDKGKEIGGGGYYGVLGEEGEKAGEVDEEAFVRELLAGGSAHNAVPQTQNRSGIVVNMTPAMATLRGGAGRARTERKTPSTRFVADDDDDALSDSTIRPSSRVAPEMVALPRDNGDFEKGGRAGKKRTKGARKSVKINLPVKDAAGHNYTSGMVGFVLAIGIAVACGFVVKPDTFMEVWNYIVAFVRETVGSMW